ncbi:MBL fold metallo-hydrolase [Microbacterium thalassium]|uniref:Glyoxylase-like metal-dependent hydrolase (Beta-lactamase superfamily II) n=1 Tax=Microbacterium thalassium TaxID=362649 RepID=A0A7X0KTG4_9MICO|nr:MBL fold metallo-hydrolase [Microbacterium thalassium]MBB6390062.1 glyoxylase-like metal-dependent hydrolase (beta-lactamase superfamily II) [Microbacterium thalassium]GLK25170.1 MBL fold metallo-hydrolase [Microbacterium thalassium]
MRELDEVAPGVLVATSREQQTTSTVLVAGGDALLIDPSWTPDELDGLAAELQSRGIRVVGGFSTHAHHDHLLWHPGFGSVPRWASPAAARQARRERQTAIAALGPGFPDRLVDLVGLVRPVGAELPRASVPRGFHPRLIIHDGHAPGHTALWLPEQRVLIAGDMLSDVELPLPFEPDDIPSYLEGLDLLADAAARAAVVIPGHGSPGPDALARLEADRAYLDDVLNARPSSDPRLGNPGMDDVDESVRRIAAGRRRT